MSETYPHLARALRITGSFEGKGIDQVTGDFDAQGISVGVLQWNYGQGSLQTEILLPWQKKYGKIDPLAEFPWPGIDATATMGSQSALMYCRRHMLNGTRVKPDWAEAWARFLKHPYTVEMQLKAAEKVGARADKLCRDWGLNSERAFCFFFDVVTQNGSMKTVVRESASLVECLAICDGPRRPSNRTLWKELLPKATTEQLVLFKAAYDRACLANPTFFQDVFSRKGTIALGRGIVHGKSWNLFPPGQ